MRRRRKMIVKCFLSSVYSVEEMFVLVTLSPVVKCSLTHDDVPSFSLMYLWFMVRDLTGDQLEFSFTFSSFASFAAAFAFLSSSRLRLPP